MGGIVDSIFGGGSDTQTVTQNNQMDPAQRQILLDMYGRAKAVADRPYQAYGGQTLAGFNWDQQHAMNVTRQGALNNVGGNTLNQAIQGTQNAMGYNPMMVSGGSVLDNLGAYQSPYTQQVIDATMSDMDRARQLTQQQNAASARAAGAFGGSRHGVVEAETNRAFADQMGQTAAGLRNQGFQTALSAANADLSRGLQAQQSNQGALYNAANLGLGAANQLAGLSDQQRQQYFGNAAMLETVGNTQQNQTQAELTDAYNKWLQQRNYPQEQTSWLAGIVNGQPSMGGTSSSTSPVYQNKGASALGGALAGAQLFGAGGALASTGIGAGWGAGLGALLGLSDENVKSGRKPANTKAALKAVEGMPIERWRYDPAKGGPDDGGAEHIGPMAQQLAKNLGIGNGHMFPVIDAVGANFAATQELAKKVRKLEGKKKGGKK